MAQKESSEQPDSPLKALVHSCSKDFYIEKGYTPIRSLGTGMTGEVMLARSKDDSNLKAVKTLSRRTPDGGKANKKLFLKEVALLQSIKHKHILGNITAFSDPDKYTMCMPYYPGGTLASQLPTLTRDLTDQYLVQLTSALLYLHRCHLVHRDIKPDNVLISEDRNVILTDFGLACVVTSAHMPHTGRCGTRRYMAPELLDTMMRHVNLYKCDMYSLGVLLRCMMRQGQVTATSAAPGCLPYHRSQSGTLQFVLENLLHKDPDTRWDSKELLRNLAAMPRMKYLVRRGIRE